MTLLPTATQADGIARPLRLGLAICALCVLGLGGFGGLLEISGAVLGRGTVVVAGSSKKVQHPSGGVVGRILVQDGTVVRQGDVVIALDETLMRANLMILVRQLDELEVRQARLKAERDGDDTFTVSGRADDAEFAALLAAEHRLFEARREARAGQKAQLAERIAQLKQEVIGLQQQKEAKAHELTFVRRELEGANSLWEKGLYPVAKLTALKRDTARLVGDENLLLAQIAQARGRISETRLQIAQVEQDLRAEAMRELREAQGRVAELAERRAGAEDQLRRVELRAPQSGVVHQLSVHTVGGVIAAGETLMEIVPQEDDLVIEVKLAATDIDSVHKGQTAFVRFPSFNLRTTPQVEGTVQRISADIARDNAAHAQPQSYYIVRVTLSSEARVRLGGVALLPGMPAEVHLRTGDHSLLSYLVKPLRDQFATALRER